MKRFALVVTFGLLAASALGQDAVTIQAPKLKTGDRVRTAKTEKTNSTVSFAAGGQSVKKDDTTTKTIVYVDEVVTAGDKGGRPVKLKRTYEKFEVSKGMGGKDEPAPPLNTPITIEKKGEKYEFTAEKPLDKAFSAKLSAEFDKAPKAEVFLPDKPVKPGDTWKLDGKKLGALVGGGEGLGVIDPDKSEMTGKLVKAYQKDGKQYGVIEFTGNVAIKGLGEKAPVTVKAGSGMNIKMTMDGCIDGSTPAGEMKGTMKLKLDAEGGGTSVNVTADGATTETTELLPK